MRRTLPLILILVILLASACHKKKDNILGAPSDSSKTPLAPGELPGDAQIKNPEVGYNMALEFANQQNMEAAQHYIDLAMSLEPNAKYSFTKGLFLIRESKYQEALTSLDEAIQLGPGTEDNRLAVLNAQGICYMGLGKDDEALAKFREVVNKPGMVSRYESYYNMGVVYLGQKRYLDAESVFQKVLEENPGYYPAYNKLGLLQEQKGDWAGAAISFQKAMDLIGNDYRAIQNIGPELYCNYGETLAQLGQYAKARDALRTVLKIAPESAFGTKAKQLLAAMEGSGG
jgi:tetratricopeptide (TPR) repeat protein